MLMDFLTILKNFAGLISLMIGLKMFITAYFGLQFIDIFQWRGLRPRSPAEIVPVQREIVLLKSLIMLSWLGD